ncbi:uncharacterized protein LOC131687411 [Topomyia yanbarensis]|uniref:uncharacterized protein LOC131687411 n=1 Tax=Topomyia yanbarensis TaxID=2498891 RepID=UPI00273AFADE|nr:uncharacterized protein LOC131687411 [Topomyia yanbarensis]
MANPVPAIPPAQLPTAFTFEPFNPSTSKFDRWLQRLEVSFRIYRIDQEDKRDYLLHYMGSATYDVLCNKLKAESPETKTFDEIVALLKAHYSPAPLEILENFKFNSRKQLDYESLCDYVTDLEKLAQSCNFGEHFDNAIRNQFVFGIRNRTVQSRLLEIRDLTLAKAKEIAFGMEMSHKGADEMHGSSSRADIQHIEHTKTKKKQLVPSSQTVKMKYRLAPDGKPKLCFRCGEADHLANKCKHQSTSVKPRATWKKCARRR